MDARSPQAEISNLILGYWKSQMVYVAAKLELADLIAAQPRTAAEIATATGAHAPTLYRLLRALASIGIFAEDAEQCFHATPLSETLRRDCPDSNWAWAIMMGEEHYNTWGDLIYSVETGKNAFQSIYGMPIFEFLAENPEKGRVFDAAMTGVHGREVEPMFPAYDFSTIGTLADIGGGNGSVLTKILKKFPHMQGLLFDLPGVIERSAPVIAAMNIASRCQLVSGDFFQQVPTGADAYILRHIIHDWDDAEAIIILKNLRAALGDGERSRILIVESIIPPGNEPFFGKLLDLTMLLIPGGKERTELEYQHLFATAGLAITRIVPTGMEISIIEVGKD